MSMMLDCELLLGHKSIRLNWRCYLNVSEKEIDAEADVGADVDVIELPVAVLARPEEPRDY